MLVRRRLKGKICLAFQIDYICVSSNETKTGKHIRSDAMVCNEKRVWRSDHSPVVLDFVEAKSFKTTWHRRSNGGWRWESAGAEEAFCDDVMTEIHMKMVIYSVS